MPMCGCQEKSTFSSTIPRYRLHEQCLETRPGLPRLSHPTRLVRVVGSESVPQDLEHHDLMKHHA